jgi:probable rRNA maturation factor
MSDTEPSRLQLLQPDIQIIKRADDWCASQVIKQSCEAVESMVLPIKSHSKPCKFSVHLTSSGEVQALNADYRQQDKPTNVLSFEAEDSIENKLLPYITLGDIIISKDVLSIEAEEQNIQEAYHLAHLVTHGLLHLYGFDHINEDEAEIMEATEIAILASMNIPNPYMKDSLN